MRDAIVFSGWSWDTFNVPERIALALASLGITVLYCENPISALRRRKYRSELRQVQERIFAFRPLFAGHRLNRIPILQRRQAKYVAQQIGQHTQTLGLTEPLFFYPWMGAFWPLCLEMRARDCPLVHIHMDHLEDNEDIHIDISDITLAIPRATFHKAKAKFGNKICLIPQSVDYQSFREVNTMKEVEDLCPIPRPRLGYLGPIHDRLNIPVLSDLLRRHPNWHFISFGDKANLPLANFHVLGWQRREELLRYITAFDVGFMPYNVYDEQQLHCLPLKLFDYFAVGIPVVSTPIVHLWEYEDVIYFGDTVDELEQATIAALHEPLDSPKKRRRIEIASEHSIENLAKVLEEILPL